MPTYTDQEIQDKLAEFDSAIPIIVSRVDAVEPLVSGMTPGADVTNYGTVETIAKNEADEAEVRANSYTDSDRLTLLTDAQTAAELAAQTKADLAETTAKAYADGIVTTAEAAAILDATNKANAAQAAAILHSDNVLASLNLQDGIAGNQWYAFNSTPATNVGVLNDFALVDGRYTYKHNGTDWIYQSDLLGEQGVQGNVGNSASYSNLFDTLEDRSLLIAHTTDSVATVTTDNFSGGFAVEMTTTVAGTLSSGNGNQFYIVIPEDLALKFAGHTIALSMYVKTIAGNESSSFSFAYSTADNGNSGFSTFVPTSIFVKYELTYFVPLPEQGGLDYIIISPDDLGEGKGIIIDSVSCGERALDGLSAFDIWSAANGGQDEAAFLETLNVEDGIDGNTWYSVTGTVANWADGVVNDFALSDGNLVYKKTSIDPHTWVFVKDLIGPPGRSINSVTRDPGTGQITINYDSGDPDYFTISDGDTPSPLTVSIEDLEGPDTRITFSDAANTSFIISDGDVARGISTISRATDGSGTVTVTYDDNENPSTFIVSDGDSGAAAFSDIPIAIAPATVGGKSDFAPVLNSISGNFNEGEVYVPAFTLTRINGSVVSVSSYTVNTNFGEGQAGKFYILYSDELCDVRFPSLSLNSGNLIGIRENNGSWVAVSNGYETEPVTLEPTDVFLAVVGASGTHSHLDQSFTYTSGIDGEDGVQGEDGIAADAIVGIEGQRWAFETNDLQGWTAQNCSNVSVVKGVLKLTSSSGDPILLSPSNLTIKGNESYAIRIRIRTTSTTHTTGIQFYYSNSTHGISGSHVLAQDVTYIQNKWQYLVLDMREISDWYDPQIINRIRFDFTTTVGKNYEIDGIVVGFFGAPDETNYEDARVSNSEVTVEWLNLDQVNNTSDVTVISNALVAARLDEDLSNSKLQSTHLFGTGKPWQVAPASGATETGSTSLMLDPTFEKGFITTSGNTPLFYMDAVGGENSGAALTCIGSSSRAGYAYAFIRNANGQLLKVNAKSQDSFIVRTRIKASSGMDQFAIKVRAGTLAGTYRYYADMLNQSDVTQDGNWQTVEKTIKLSHSEIETADFYIQVGGDADTGVLTIDTLEIWRIAAGVDNTVASVTSQGQADVARDASIISFVNIINPGYSDFESHPLGVDINNNSYFGLSGNADYIEVINSDSKSGDQCISVVNKSDGNFGCGVYFRGSIVGSVPIAVVPGSRIIATYWVKTVGWSNPQIRFSLVEDDGTQHYSTDQTYTAADGEWVQIAQTVNLSGEVFKKCAFRIYSGNTPVGASFYVDNVCLFDVTDAPHVSDNENKYPKEFSKSPNLPRWDLIQTRPGDNDLLNNNIVESHLVGTGTKPFTVKPNKWERVEDTEQGRFTYNVDGGIDIQENVFSSTERIKLNYLRQGYTPDGAFGISNDDAATDATSKVLVVSDRVSSSQDASNINTNPLFDNWSGTLPDYWNNWSSTTVTKDTLNTRSSLNSVKFENTGTVDNGISFDAYGLDNHEYIEVEMEVKLLSGDFKSAGLLVDWRPQTSNYRVHIALHDLYPSPNMNVWYSTRVIIKRPSNDLTGTFHYRFYLMGNYSGLAGGKADKTIVFNNLFIKPATEAAILAYNSSNVASGFADTARSGAVSDAKGDPDLANSSTTWSHLGGTRPSELTDGRISLGLDSSGNLNRNIPSTRLDSSDVMRFSGGGQFTGALNSNRVVGAVTTNFGKIRINIDGTNVDLDAVTESQVDDRANGRIGVLRPDSTYKNSSTTWLNLGGTRPSELTDGRVSAGLNSAGDLQRDIQTSRLNSSNVMRYGSSGSGGLFTGALNSNRVLGDVTTSFGKIRINIDGSNVDLDAVTESQVDERANSRIGTLRPDGTYKNSQIVDTDIIGSGRPFENGKPTRVVQGSTGTFGRVRLNIDGVNHDLEAVTATQVDDRANSRIGTLRPNSDYQNSQTTKAQVGLGTVDDKSSTVLKSEAITQAKLESLLLNNSGAGINFFNGKYQNPDTRTQLFGQTRLDSSKNLINTGTHGQPSGGNCYLLAATGGDAYVYLARNNTDVNTPIIPNRKWLVSVYLKAVNAASANGNVQIYMRLSNGTFRGSSMQAGAAGQWVRSSAIIDCEADSPNTCIIRLDNDSADVENPTEILFDQIMLELYIEGANEPSPYSPPINQFKLKNQRTIPMVNLAGASASMDVNPLTSTDAGSDATIHIANHSVRDSEGLISYTGGSIGGKAYTTAYYVYCDDYDSIGGAVTYIATENLQDLTSDSARRYIGRVSTPSSGGGTSTPPPDQCVDENMWLTPYLQAKDAVVGDDILVRDTGYPALVTGSIQAIKKGISEECIKLITESNCQVICTLETPISRKDGSSFYAKDSLNEYVYVKDNGIERWELVTQVFYIGERNIVRISVGDISFLSGTNNFKQIVTHNALKP
jgi:hypothetical protein